MKKMLLLTVLFVICCFVNGVSASENNIKDYGEYIVFENYNIYEVEGSYLMNFIDNPSIEFLDKVCLSKFRYVRHIKQSGNSFLSYSSFEDAIDNDEEVLSIRLPLFSEENLKYISNENMNAVLKNNNVEGEVRTVALINFFWETFDNCPIIVWINTKNNENYYLIYEYEKVDGEFKGVPEFCKIKLSTQKEFEEKFRWKEGSLFINGTKIEGNLQPIFQGDTLRVPLRAILEEYGFKVEWDMENKVIIVSRENVKYAVLLNADVNTERFKSNEYGSDIIQIPFCENIFFKDERIYVGVYDRLWELMKSLGINEYQCNVDYDNKSVYINGILNN